jgi:hypothetical protein
VEVPVTYQFVQHCIDRLPRPDGMALLTLNYNE